jgi:hypothetical protein
VTRRGFLRTSAAAAGAAAGLGLSGHAALGADPPAEVQKTRSYRPGMEYRRLGKTGLWVSAVCLGGHWKRIDKVLATGERDALAANRRQVIHHCLDVGINYVDACMDSEILAYAKALGSRREEIYFGYSWHCWEPRAKEWRTADKLLQGFEEGLKRAGLEYADLWRITMHERGSRHTDAEADEMAKALDRARRQGKCRFTGFSSHDRPWIERLIRTYPGQVQAVCTPYTAASMELPADSLFETVRKFDVGIFGIKPFASNSLFQGDGSPDGPYAEADDERARLAVRYILSNPAITAPIPGLISVHQVDNMVAAVKERRELDRREKARLERAAEEMLANLPPEYQWLKDWQYV